MHELCVPPKPEEVGSFRCRAAHEEGRRACVAQAQHVQIELRHVPHRDLVVRPRVAHLKGRRALVRACTVVAAEGRMILHLKRLD
eukprot:749611-Prymnesium_polylepis.1